MSPYYYTIDKLKPYGKKLNIWESCPIRGYAERVGGAIIALKDKREVDIRINLAIEKYKQKYPGLLSLKEVMYD